LLARSFSFDLVVHNGNHSNLQNPRQNQRVFNAEFNLFFCIKDYFLLGDRFSLNSHAKSDKAQTRSHTDTKDTGTEVNHCQELKMAKTEEQELSAQIERLYSELKTYKKATANPASGIDTQILAEHYLST
jgi:hypothetical protein